MRRPGRVFKMGETDKQLQQKHAREGCLIVIGALLAFFVMVMSLVGFWAVVDDGLLEPNSYELGFFSVAFLVWGYLAYWLRAKMSKIFLGIGSLAVAVLANWIELQKLAETKNGKPYEHLVVILAAIAVAAHGFKQLHDARAGKDIDAQSP
jgi:hypothetical protein